MTCSLQFIPTYPISYLHSVVFNPCFYCFQSCSPSSFFSVFFYIHTFPFTLSLMHQISVTHPRTLVFLSFISPLSSPLSLFSLPSSLLCNQIFAPLTISPFSVPSDLSTHPPLHCLSLFIIFLTHFLHSSLPNLSFLCLLPTPIFLSLPSPPPSFPSRFYSFLFILFLLLNSNFLPVTPTCLLHSLTYPPHPPFHPPPSFLRLFPSLFLP